MTKKGVIMRFLFLLLLRLLLGLLSLLFRLLLMPLFLIVFRLLRGLVSLSMSATVHGPIGFIDRLAGEWTERIVQITENRKHVAEVFQFCRFLIGALIVLGWLVAGFFTVSILRIVFGFFT
jgi:hypothetical protein